MVTEGDVTGDSEMESVRSIIIANDGVPFDVSAALGPEAGHYGLTNMRERALRSGFGIEWENDKKWMKVRLTLKG